MAAKKRFQHLSLITAAIGLAASLVGIGAFIHAQFSDTVEEQTLSNSESIIQIQTEMSIDLGEVKRSLTALSGPAAELVATSGDDGGAQLSVLATAAQDGRWTTGAIYASPGNDIRVLVTLSNSGAVRLTDMTLGLILQNDRVDYVDGSTELFNGNNPDGVRLSSNNIDGGGINLGNYAPQGWSYVTFTLTAASAGWSCGTHPAGLTAVAKAAADSGSELPIAVSTPAIFIRVDC